MTNQEIKAQAEKRENLITGYDQIDALTRASLTPRMGATGMMIFGEDFPDEVADALEEMNEAELKIESNLLSSVGFIDSENDYGCARSFYCELDSLQGIERKANGNFNLTNPRIGKTRTFRNLGALVIFLKEKNIYSKTIGREGK